MKRTPLLMSSAAALLTGLACLCGCNSTPTHTIERAQPAGQRDMVDDKRLLVSAGLDARARVLGVNQAQTPGGLLKVQVEIMNTSRYSKRFNYKWEWFDQNGMQVTTPATDVLNPVQIDGKETMSISSVAPTPDCKDFRLKLTKAQ